MRSKHGRTGGLGAQASFKGKEDSTGEIKQKQGKDGRVWSKRISKFENLRGREVQRGR